MHVCKRGARDLAFDVRRLWYSSSLSFDLDSLPLAPYSTMPLSTSCAWRPSPVVSGARWMIKCECEQRREREWPHSTDAFEACKRCSLDSASVACLARVHSTAARQLEARAVDFGLPAKQGRVVFTNGFVMREYKCGQLGRPRKSSSREPTSALSLRVCSSHAKGEPLLYSSPAGIPLWAP